MMYIVNSLLYAVYGLVGILLSIAITLLDWAINPASFIAVVNSNAIFAGWQKIRDILNMAFILVLLYSAFCTVFGVEKYNYKKILLTLVIMALLVNFSFPISRFIIDTSNVMTYSLLGKVFSGMTQDSGYGNALIEAGRITSIATQVNGTDILFASLGVGSTTQVTIQLLMAIIFLFIFAGTILVIGVLFIIRIVVLSILVVFSPIGFVGNIFPAFKQYADKWWTALLKQAFFAPIMIFMLELSIYLMKEMNKADCLKNGFLEALRGINPAVKAPNDYSNLIVTFAMLAIPIALLWTGMIMSKELGAYGAEAVTGKASKWMKGAGKKFSGMNYLKKQYGDYKKARDARKEGGGGKPGKFIGDSFNDAQDKFMAGGDPNSKAGKRYNKRKEEKNKKDIKEESEGFESKTEAELHTDIKTMTPATVTAMSDKDVKVAAGKVKQAFTRGSLYEKEIEGDINSGGYTPLVTPRPYDSYYTPPTPAARLAMNVGQLANETQKKEDAKKKMDEWVRSEKAAHSKQAREVIKEAEKRGKI